MGTRSHGKEQIKKNKNKQANKQRKIIKKEENTFVFWKTKVTFSVSTSSKGSTTADIILLSSILK